MDVRQLRYFLVVIEQEHMTRAAELLFVSQPALSQQIAALERELGTPLFDRVGRGLQPTAAGRLLREHALRIVREFENARRAIDDLRGALRGELTIATIQTANVGFLVEVIAAFRSSHPGVVVRAREVRSQEVAEWVRAGEADLGITYVPLEDSRALQSQPLYAEDLVLVVPAGHELSGRTIRPTEIADLPLIMPPGGYCLRRGIDAVLTEAGGGQRIVAEIAAIEGICEAVRIGVGLAILPSRYIEARSERERLAIVRLVDPVPTRVVGAVTSQERHVCRSSAAFLAALVDVAKKGHQEVHA